VSLLGGINMNKKTKTLPVAAKKGETLRPSKRGNSHKQIPRPSREAHYRSVAVRIPGNSSLMVVHVKEY
jgi:hypothetical protein